MAIKLLINFTLALMFICAAYSLFYFEVIPKLINHYRKFTVKGRQYDAEIKDIKKKKKKN